MWTFENFTATQILDEIKFANFEGSKTVILIFENISYLKVSKITNTVAKKSSNFYTVYQEESLFWC